MKKKKRITAFDVVVHIIAIFLLIIVIYPLIWVLSSSFSTPGAGRVVLLPKGFSLEGYRLVFMDRQIMRGYINSIFYTVVGTMVNLLVTVPAGYVLSKKIPGNSFIMTMFLITMYFSGGMIPTFLLVKGLGLYDSILALMLPGAFGVYNCIICRSFFLSIPKELEEAAEMDGSSPMLTFTKIVIPLSKALLGVMVLYFAVGHWNSYFDAMIYINNDNKHPLQVFLRRILVLSQNIKTMLEQGIEVNDMDAIAIEAQIRYSVIVVASVPLMVTYPFLQKYFDQGVLIGSVKG